MTLLVYTLLNGFGWCVFWDMWTRHANDGNARHGQSGFMAYGRETMRRHKAWRALLFAAVAWLGVEVALSNRHLYGRLLEPKSYAGRVTEVLVAAGRFESENIESGRVLVLGDSRMGEGFSARLANESETASFRWFNGAVAGSTLRVWAFLLERLAGDGCRYDWVVAPLQSYAAASIDRKANRILDVQCMVPLSNPWKALRFAGSFEDRGLRVPMFVRAAVPSVGLRDDILALLRDPVGRFQGLIRPGSLYRSMYAYRGRNDNVASVLSWDGENYTFSPGTDVALQKELGNQLSRVPSLRDVSAETDYQRHWMSVISRACARMGARLVILRAPRGPMGMAYAKETDADLWSILDPGMETPVVLRCETFVPLETPLHFFDSVHMNALGREAFTSRLAAELETCKGRGH